MAQPSLFALSRAKGITYALLTAISFGLIPLITSEAVENGYGALSLSIYKWAFAAAMFAIVILIRRPALRVTLRQVLEIIFVAICCNAGSAYFLFRSYEVMPTGIVTTINFLYPAVVALAMWILFGQRLSWGLRLAILVSFAGVALLAYQPTGGHLFNAEGLTLCLITVLCNGTLLVSLDRLSIRNVPPDTLSFYLFSATALFLLALIPFAGPLHPIESSAHLVSLILLALVGTLIPNFTLLLAIRHIGPTTTGILGCFEPLTALTLGMIFLGEQVSLVAAIGAVLVIGAVSLIIRYQK